MALAHCQTEADYFASSCDRCLRIRSMPKTRTNRTPSQIDRAPYLLPGSAASHVISATSHALSCSVTFVVLRWFATRDRCLERAGERDHPPVPGMPFDIFTRENLVRP